MTFGSAISTYQRTCGTQCGSIMLIYANKWERTELTRTNCGDTVLDGTRGTSAPLKIRFKYNSAVARFNALIWKM